jgi:hypothetical protein
MHDDAGPFRALPRWAWLIVVCLLLSASATASTTDATTASTTAGAQRPLRIALVPLDDRPVCLQYPQKMAALAHAELVSPPMASLGRFTVPGDTRAIARWLQQQDLASLDALIVSVDMLAYGGLVASRVHQIGADQALATLEVLREIHRQRPSLPIFGFSVIMRLAPTADGVNEAWRVPLARWAEISPYTRTDSAFAEEAAALRTAIPAEALRDYQQARARNLRVNRAAVDLLAEGVFTHLVLSQDDARPRGVHVADREMLTADLHSRQLTDRAGLQPGADEVAMLLLARAVLQARGMAPTVHAIYSSEATRTMVAPFEDRPLHETVRFQLHAAGATADADADADADLLLFVYASRHEPARAASFADAIADALAAGRRVVVADIDPKGDVQGASADFTEALLARDVPRRLHGYASWNTAGNTTGTAIPHALLYHAGTRLAPPCGDPPWQDVARAQVTFLLHRLLNDYAYQGVVRQAVNADLRAEGRSSLWLREHAGDVEARLLRDLGPYLERFARVFSQAPRPPLHVHLTNVRNVHLSLPWARTFEALIAFDVDVEPGGCPPGKPHAPRTPHAAGVDERLPR